MTRALLNFRAADHLAKLCGMFGSDYDGERAAAARMADEHVKRLGLTWRDVINVDADWRTMARACAGHPALFNDREIRFVKEMARGRFTPTDKQMAWLTSLHDRLGEVRS